MDREAFSNYSINTSRSHISYISNINNFIQDSNLYNQANLIEMLRNIRQDNENITEEENSSEHNAHQENIENNSNTNTINSINSYDLFNEMSVVSNNNNQHTSSNITNDDGFFEEPDYMLLNHGRAATAPARPLNEAEEFKWSTQYSNLEKAVFYCNRLIILKPESKFDVDTEEGSEICKKFLEQLEKLIKVNF
jgi:hypothetical protein